MQICKDQNFIPHVMHLHDWMTALVAAFLKTWDRVLSPLSHTASVLTIHNIGYQGIFIPARWATSASAPSISTPMCWKTMAASTC
jgi:glycogen synthase